LTLRFILPVLAALILGCSTHTGRNVAGIRNFGPPTAGGRLYRGAQPSARGFDTLASMGVKTVVNLRNDARPSERDAVESRGMRYVSLGLTCAEVKRDSVDAKLRAFLTLMEDPRNGPVFVHCREGKDRTGLFVAVYRMVDESRSRTAALQELSRYGHDRVPIKLFTGIDEYLATFEPARFARASSGATELSHATATDKSQHGN